MNEETRLPDYLRVTMRRRWNTSPTQRDYEDAVEIIQRQLEAEVVRLGVVSCELVYEEAE